MEQSTKQKGSEINENRAMAIGGNSKVFEEDTDFTIFLETSS